MELVANTKIGLQCHTAPFSWKIVFESNQQLFEMVLCACSNQEEEQWKTSMLDLSTRASQNRSENKLPNVEHYSTLSLDIKSVGNILGQPGTLARRISIQRAGTVVSRSNITQVVIKNTHTSRDNANSSGMQCTYVVRSHSLLPTSSRTPVLSPRRIDRVRVEQEATKVWTKDLIPYPGMSTAAKRVSATSVIRKFSKTNITSSFSKRSVSHASTYKTKLEDYPRRTDVLDLNRRQLGPAASVGSADGCVMVIENLGHTGLSWENSLDDSKLTATSLSSMFPNQTTQTASSDSRHRIRSTDISEQPRGGHFSFVRHFSMRGTRIYFTLARVIRPRASREAKT